MATLTIRLPDAHRDRLAAMAARRGVSLNKLMEELSVRALAEQCGSGCARRAATLSAG